MRKIIILSIMVFILTGCTANYKISLIDDTVRENLTLIETDTTLFDVPNDAGFTLRQSLDIVLNQNEDFVEKNYKIKSLSNSHQLGLKYTSDSSEKIINSTVLNQCYTNPTLVTEGKTITFDSGKEFDCFEFYQNLDMIEIEFKTNHKVISTNADEKVGNKYIWKISRGEDPQIIISYSKETKNSDFTFYIVLVGILLLVGLIVSLIRNKGKRENII